MSTATTKMTEEDASDWFDTHLSCRTKSETCEGNLHLEVWPDHDEIDSLINGVREVRKHGIEVHLNLFSDFRGTCRVIDALGNSESDVETYFTAN